MGTVGWLARRHIRHRAVALTALALIAALGTAGTLVAAGAAQRTAGAYTAYRRHAEVSDVVINPSLVSSDIDRAIRALPGVISVTSDALLNGGVDHDVHPRTQAEIDADPTQILTRSSTDGRYLTMDRPALTQGRLPSGDHEALVTVELAKAEHIAIGDVLPFSFWSRRTELIGETGPLPPVGVEHVKVVGIATMPDEVLPDGLYPRQTLILSPDIGARYDCLPDQPPRDTSLEETILQMAPEACATSYRYYSIAVQGGDKGVTAVLEAFNAAAAKLTAELPQGLQDMQVGYTLVAKTTTAEEERRVERSTQPIVVALDVLALAAGAVTAFVVGLGLSRELLRAGDDQVMWWRLGLTRRERVPILALPVLAAVAAGLLAGAAGAWVLSPVGPVGNVRSIAPSPGREMAGQTWLVLVALAAVLIGIAVWSSWRSARRVGIPVPHPVSSAPRRLPRSGSPALIEGLRSAYRTRRGAGLVLASGGAAVAVFVAALVFGVSLTSLLATPRSYGWSWDVATIDNFGYGGIRLDAVRTTVEGRDDIARWTALGFSNSTTLDGDPVPSVLAFDTSSDVDIAVVQGRLPRADGEVALGARTAAERGIAVGDSVKVTGYEVPARSATVTGLVVLPALGPFRADRTAPGIGMLVPEAMLDREQLPQLVSFVGIGLRPGTDRAAAFASLRAEFATWDDSELTTFDLAGPIRPAEIIDARSMRVSPLLVGGLLVAGATIGLAIGIAMSVRARRRDLGVLRVLGFTGRQLRGSVLVQAVASVAGGVVVGVPVGVVVGRLAWQGFASRLGVVTEPSTPVLWIAVTAVGAIVVALAAAALPARSAARSNPSSLLLATGG
ncbi:MAG TPA: FtsX-like permease family protein [Acidimicrobiales bacterium]